MTSFVFKIIALISMLCDHTGYIIFGKFSFMNYIGRLAFPIFAYSITEGYTHTSNLKKYFSRLLSFAIISQIPYMLFMNTLTNNFTLNILFTLTLGLLTITIYDKVKNTLLGFILVVLSAILAHFLRFEYGWFGIAVIFIFYIFKQHKVYMNMFFIFTTFLMYIFKFAKTYSVEYLFIILFCSLSLIPINLYNGKKGKNIKYLLYMFYPFHLLVLYLISLI